MGVQGCKGGRKHGRGPKQNFDAMIQFFHNFFPFAQARVMLAQTKKSLVIFFWARTLAFFFSEDSGNCQK